MGARKFPLFPKFRAPNSEFPDRNLNVALLAWALHREEARERFSPQNMAESDKAWVLHREEGGGEAA